MFIYQILVRKSVDSGHHWYFAGERNKKLDDKELVESLNYYGAEHWELVTKEDQSTYIFKKEDVVSPRDW